MAGIATPRFQLNLMVDDRDKKKQVYNLNNQSNKIILNPSYLHNNATSETNKSGEKAEQSKLKRGKIVSIGTSCIGTEDTFSQSIATGGKNIHKRSEKSITLGANSTILNVKTEEESPDPDFDEIIVQDIIKDVLKVKLQGLIYDHEKFRHDSAAISLEIHDRLKKKCLSDAYKLSVNVFVGEVRGEGVETATLCSWDPKYDCIVCGYYKNTSVFAIATVFASYFA